MYDFMEYCLRRYYPLLDFQVPKGLSLRLSKLPSSVFKTTSTMNALPVLDGSIGYLFTSRPLQIDDSASVRFRHMVDRFRIICLDHGIREADQWSEYGPDGKRRKDYLLSGRLNLANARLEALYSRRVSKHRQYVISGVSDPASKAASHISAQYQYDKGKYCAEVSFTTDDGLIGIRGLYNFGQDFDNSFQTMQAERQHQTLGLQAELGEQQRVIADVMGLDDEGKRKLREESKRQGDVEGGEKTDATRRHGEKDEDLVPKLKESARMMMFDPALGSSAVLDEVDMLEEVEEETGRKQLNQRTGLLQDNAEAYNPEDEWAGESKERTRGYWSAGAELYYSATEKLGGVSMGLRYRTLPPLTPLAASADGHPYPTSTGPEHHQNYIPMTITQTLNPIMGHVSSSYAAQVSPDLGLCSRFDFNLYSYDSELTVGLEWWLREKRSLSSSTSITPPPPPSLAATLQTEDDGAGLVKTLEERRQERLQMEQLEAEAATQNQHPHSLAPVIGVLKARFGIQSGLAILWEGRFNKLLFSFGVVADMIPVAQAMSGSSSGARRSSGLSSSGNASGSGVGGGRPQNGVNVRSIGLEIQYFS
ncbi:Mitochondrial distribution and morphology protein 10 [Actinomortierella wolfii]|nr:Mitochondrial distribution and morphology protein 10 [Actinomortierella wolfii]